MPTSELYLAGSALEGRTGHEAGRVLLSTLYRQATGEALPPIAVTERGKPYIPGSPWHFSITHTPRRAFCALARQPVGIDAEELDRQVNPAVARRMLSLGELAQYRAAADPNRALLTLWVLKEARAKRTGQGLGDWIRRTNFPLDHPAVRIWDGCVVAVLTEENDHAL